MAAASRRLMDHHYPAQLLQSVFSSLSKLPECKHKLIRENRPLCRCVPLPAKRVKHRAVVPRKRL